jgi:uncharacterized protein with GYD domain
MTAPRKEAERARDPQLRAGGFESRGVGSSETAPAVRHVSRSAPGDDERRQLVPKYVTLYNWTDKGVAEAKETVNRYQAAKQLVESKGGTIDAILWTAGPYDIVTITDFPDAETGTAVSLQLAEAGYLRTTTMPAFTEDEMKGIVDKMG